MRARLFLAVVIIATLPFPALADPITGPILADVVRILASSESVAQ